MTMNKKYLTDKCVWKYGNTVNGKGTIFPVIGRGVYGGVNLWLQAFLSLELSPCRFALGEIVLGSHCAGSSRILDTSKKRKVFCPFLKSNHYPKT